MKPVAALSNAKHWATRLTVALAVAALSACIIGPKQDDPEAASVDETDTGAVEDTTRADPADTNAVPLDETGLASDSAPSADVGASDTGMKTACGDAGDAGDVGDARDAADAPPGDGAGCGADGGGDAVSAD